MKEEQKTTAEQPAIPEVENVEVVEITPQADVIKFKEGDIVFHRVDEQGCRGVVIGILMQPGHYKYLVRWVGMDDLLHFDYELSKTPVPVPASEEERDGDLEEEL